MDCQTNQYEEQLYSVFKSFDINNEEALDESAVYRLCDALQLEERGAALVDTLFEKRAGRVTFSQFRSGLLAVLGDRPEGESSQPSAHATAAEPSDDDSSGREVAPRFVFGSKKYGRRSRPQAGEPEAAAPPPRALSASRVDTSPPHRPRPRRSASAMEARGDSVPPPDHDARVDRDEALALCRDLRMDAIDRSLVDRVFDEARATDTSVGEFFERLNATLATTVEESRPAAAASLDAAAADADADEDDATLPADLVIEAWEGGGVRRPRRLLADLGFTGAALPAAELERALDEEARAGPPLDPSAAAALALARLRAARATARAARLADERDRLRAAVTEADRRARLLAQEVDESHARLEAELRATLRRADARHADETRRVAREAAAEAERAAADRAWLESELARRDELEARLRAALAGAGERADRAEAQAAQAEDARAGVARERDRLAEALLAAEARAASAEAASAAAAGLEARLADTAKENVQLRERVDELAAELAAPRPAPDPTPSAAGALSAELQAAAAPAEPARPSPLAPDGGGEPDSYDEDEKQKLIELVKELECSLEAMRGEYEACEEYWAGKVASERAAHEAEAAAADARLAELAARVADFERRLRPARAPALAPIAEQAALEAQVAALEAELAAARRAPRRPPCARCQRTAMRAECAVRRLTARLQAADLLVKDLYVENCELARRRLVP